jgi:hypothetical protein
MAHSPMLMCYDEGDGTILCEAGWSDGSSAAGSPVYLRDTSGNNLARGAVCPAGFIEFEKPRGEFNVFFDGGEGHTLELHSSEITQ